MYFSENLSVDNAKMLSALLVEATTKAMPTDEISVNFVAAESGNKMISVNVLDDDFALIGEIEIPHK